MKITNAVELANTKLSPEKENLPILSSFIAESHELAHDLLKKLAPMEIEKAAPMGIEKRALSRSDYAKVR